MADIRHLGILKISLGGIVALVEIIVRSLLIALILNIIIAETAFKNIIYIKTYHVVLFFIVKLMVTFKINEPIEETIKSNDIIRGFVAITTWLVVGCICFLFFSSKLI